MPRGFGVYGDMVLFLKDGTKLELRSLPSFRETEDFILEKMSIDASKASLKDVQGFAA